MANEQKLASAATQNSAAVQQIPDPSEQLPPDASERQPTEDPNLFDEEARRPSAQDVDIVDSDKDIPAETQRDAVTRESSAEATRLGRLTLDDSIPKGILGDVLLSPPSAMKKGKRKSAGGMKKYPPQEPIIIILDSLGLAHPRTVRALKDYILEEGKAKRSMEAIITQNAFYVRGPHIPMQPNYTDCGVYLLGYLQKFLSEPRTFVKSVLAREMDVETDWPNMKAPAIRNAMRDILMKLAEQQGATKKKKKKLALKKETLSEGPKPQTASSAPVTLPADALPPSTTSIAKENMKHAPPTTAKDDEVDPEEEKTRSGSPTQQVSSHVESSATIPPLAPSSTADEELITSPLMASLESDEAPGGQRARLESPIIFETPSDVSQPSVKLTADGEPKTSKRRSSPRVIIPIRSPEKLKRTLDDPKPHDGDETRGSAVEYEPASKESSPKRLKITDGKSTPRLSRSSATARQSPRNADTDTLPEASSPYVTGTRSLQPTPQQSPLARGSSVNPIEINDSQETIGQPSPTAIRPGSPSPAEGVMQSRVRSQSAKSPRPPITKDPRNVEHRGAPSNRIGQNSFAKLEQERRKQRSQQRSQSPERTIASPARVGADERLPNTNRQRRPSVEEVASFPRPRSSAGPGRAFGRPSTQLSAPHRGGVSPTVMHSTAPSRIRSNRDSPEVQDLEEGDLWDTGRKPPLPTRRRRSTIAESPEPELVELREQAGPLHEDEKVFYHFGKSP